MTLADTAFNRLRKFYRKGNSNNLAESSQPSDSRPSPHATAPQVQIEQLEPRLLLSAAADSQALEMFHTQDALFAENNGQWANEDIYFGYSNTHAQIYFTDSGLEFGLTSRELKPGADADDSQPGDYDSKLTQFSLQFDGAQAVTPTGARQAATKFNYHVGDQSQWTDGVNTFKKVIYDGLYSGIDLHTFSRHGQMKYEFYAAPGSDHDQIQLSYAGIESLRIAKDGSLRIRTAAGTLVDDAPYIYQEIDGKRVEVAGEFELIDADTYGFNITGDYDAAVQLVIDPSVNWATYIGGSGDDSGYAIITDPAGNVYVGGETDSTGWISGYCDNKYDGNVDGYVMKLTSSGGHVWSTYLGGNKYDGVTALAMDSLDNVYVGGHTSSYGWVRSGYDRMYNGGWLDAFAIKLTSSGAHLWSTYVGGDSEGANAGADNVNAIAVDSLDNLYVAGWTTSADWVSDGYDTTYDGASDGYVVKITS